MTASASASASAAVDSAREAPRPTRPSYPVGTILRVRGWLDGQQLPARLAVVVAEAGEGPGDRPVLWFYGQGAPETGVTLQPFYLDSEFEETGRSMLGLSPASLARWERLLGPTEGYLRNFGWKVHQVRRNMLALQADVDA